MHSIALHLRSLIVILAFLVIALLLPNDPFEWLHRAEQYPMSHKRSSVIVNKHLNFAQKVALTSGRHKHFIEIFSPLHNQTHDKRALDPTHNCLVEKGRKYWEEGVLPAFDGHSPFPTPNFGDAVDKLADSGWMSFEASKQLPKWWYDAFKSDRKWWGGKKPREDVQEIYLEQSHDFKNEFGEWPATSAQYHARYMPKHDAILTTLCNSPRFKLGQRGVPAEDIPKQLPRMNQLSDLLWYTWDLETDHPESLRYYAVEGIVSTVVRPLMMEIFQARRGTEDVPWDKRITFDLTSDEGKALFGSPIGVAVNWFLIHHAAVLGRREPRVTIFNPVRTNNRGNNYCMIWDLIPEGKKGSFGKVEKEPKKGKPPDSKRRRAM
ncbi:MAG: hypothetical protein Q9213_008331 [Squamulea squamosa]